MPGRIADAIRGMTGGGVRRPRMTGVGAAGAIRGMTGVECGVRGMTGVGAGWRNSRYDGHREGFARGMTEFKNINCKLIILR